MRFSWDDAKNRGNRRKHGVGFGTAVRVFLDPMHITRRDRVADDEQRWHTIGKVDGALLLIIAYTVIDEDEEWLRIISARKVTRRERIEYEEANEI
jgi:uncharacterized DUF497 family protein